MTKGKQQLALEEPFPSEMIDTVPKEGRQLSYVPVGEVIQRLNDVLGVTGWSWEPTKIWRDSLDPEWVLAVGVMECTIDGQTSKKGGSGGVKVKRTKKDSSIVDLGDEFKGAESDALKKAAQRFGVGLWLARTKEAREYEAPLPVRDAVEEGWESEQRAREICKDLQDRIKTLGFGAEMRQFMSNKDILWPPTFEQYQQLEICLEQFRNQRDKAMQATPISRSDEQALAEAGVPPEELDNEPENETQEVKKTIGAAFPGAQDVSPAPSEMVQVVEDLLNFLKNNDDKASIRAWNKYAKEKEYPKDKKTWTVEQAKQAADFLETL